VEFNSLIKVNGRERFLRILNLSLTEGDEMQTVQTPESDEYGYGLGFYIRNDDGGNKMVEHDGGVAGYHAYMVFNTESKIGVIMMRNYTFGLTNILLEPRILLADLVELDKTR
jgi:CubicO group peptidase (beta-lactamase class C family)